MKKKIAIFDIDGTIFRSSLLIELTEALIQAGIFPQTTRKMYSKEFHKWVDRSGEYAKYVNAVVRAFAKAIKGKNVREVNVISARIVEFHKNRVYRYTRDLLKELRRKKYYIVAISGSPWKTVKQFCRIIGFNEIFGTEYLSKNGVFTGEHTIHKDKSKILKEVLKRNGFSLTDSVGVGDTEGDIPFLKMVERPICFNPNKNLYEYAKRHGWHIVVERKDVIYKL